MNKFRQLFTFIRPYWVFALLNVAFNILAIILSLVSLTLLIPFLQLLFDQVKLVTVNVPLSFTLDSLSHNFNYYLSLVIIQKGKFPALAFISTLVVILFFLRNLTRYLAMYIAFPMRTGVVKDIRNALYFKVLILPLGYFTEQRKGDIMSRISNDVMEIEWSIMNSLMMVFRDPFAILLFLITLLIINPLLTVVVGLFLPVTGLLINYIGKILNRYSLKGQKKLGSLVSRIEETIHGIKIIKAFNAFSEMEKRFRSLNIAYTRLMNKVYRRRELSNPLTEFLAIFVLVAIIWFGGRMVLEKTHGMNADIFLFYLAVFSQLIPPAKNLITAYYYIEKGMASLERINEVLLADEVILEAPDAISLSSFNKSIEYQDVTFTYGNEPVLKNINLVIGKGRKIALVGPSGAGKSTLVDLLPRFYDCTSGQILLDGIPINRIKIDDLRSVFGIVTQETVLFNDTVFNNIAFGKMDVTEEEVVQAAKVANAHEFIMQMGKGYLTNIGDRGVKLSGGQRQRISLARAILRDPPILILDEATSALDTESEKLVQEALEKVLIHRTAIIIAHRLSTLKIADEIIVLQNGIISQRGSHHELFNKEGLYRKLYQMQQ
ncbi:MAG: ABC transporter ATP-binding protein [Bacteroidetes bacterium]|nr:ABC transporter ATP-binding protein [Bacteroidota bacterium]